MPIDSSIHPIYKLTLSGYNELSIAKVVVPIADVPTPIKNLLVIITNIYIPLELVKISYKLFTA